MKLEGKVAIVTAAGRGIGRGIALELAAAGADVVVNSFSEDTTRSTADAVRALGRKALPVVGDITQPDKILDLVDQGQAASSIGKAIAIVQVRLLHNGLEMLFGCGQVVPLVTDSTQMIMAIV